MVVFSAFWVGRCCRSRISIFKIRFGEEVVVFVSFGWGDLEKGLMLGRGLGLNVFCCSKRSGRLGCMVFVRFFGILVFVSCWFLVGLVLFSLILRK